MEDDRNQDPPAPEQQAGNGASSTRAAPTRGRRWVPLIIAVGILGPVVLLAAWIFIALHWHYSVGNRAGYIQKFSQKGWLCKTWEGELAMVNLPGAAQERFLFSVRNDSVAQQITRRMGGHVTLTYEEHRGIPTSCFGDTQYYVKGVEQIP